MITTWQGIELLTVEPNRKGTIGDALERKVASIDPGPGERWIDDLQGVPAPIRSFHWYVPTRADARDAREFLDRRLGRTVPFWMPSWQQDLRLNSQIISGGTIVNLVWIGYTLHLFPTYSARRHIMIHAPGATPSYHKITFATDPGNRLNESIAIEPAVDRTWPMATTVLSFLRLCRLESDFTEITWHTGHVAEAVLQVREIPNEVPV